MSKTLNSLASTGAKTAVKPAVKRSTQESLAILQQCCKWLHFTYSGEIAELAKCRRRLNIEPPCRSNIEPGRVASF